jgi:hypothetical protein
MLCSKCGIDTGNDLQFCTKCGGRSIGSVSTLTTGGAAAAVAPALYQVPKSKPKEPEPNLAVWVLLPILAVAIWFTATGVRQLERLSTPSHIVQIANTPVTVTADRYYYYEFEVPPDVKNAIVKGHFNTAGGTGEEIEAYILNKGDFENWWNGKQSQTFYHSGKVNRSTINARLPAGDVYYLLLNNQVSQASSKVVEIDATLTYNP